MMNMQSEEKPLQYRKIQLSSSRTRLISLPRDWAKRNALEKDSIVIIRELPNDALLLLPAKKPVEKKKTEPPLIESSRIRRDLLRAYLDGYDIIEIKSADGPLKFRDQIHEASRNLIGLEILEEDSERMEIHFLIEPSPTLDPLLLIRRCFSIAAGMERDTIQAVLTGDSNLVQSVIKRDDEVDRLYFLIVRILKTATHLLSETTSFQLDDALNLRMLASYAEGMADQSVTLAKKIRDDPIPELGKDIAQRIRILTEKSSAHLNAAINVYVKRNVDAAAELVDIMKDLEVDLDKLDKEFGEENYGPKTYRFLYSLISLLRRNFEIIIDVADLVNTEEDQK